MCTVTAIPWPNDNGVRIICNRDEQRTRAAAAAPSRKSLHGVAAVWPTDPESGGTWIAGNEYGLILAILNGNPPGRRRIDAPLSRGAIIPMLAHVRSFDDALGRARLIDGSQHRPFRLLIFQHDRVAEVVGNGRRIDLIDPTRFEQPLMRTSSGLGDHIVERPRRELFDTSVASRMPTDWPIAQEAYHRHAWPDRLHLSVSMERDDAKTVSMTVVEVRPAQLTMRYAIGVPDFHEMMSEHVLPLPSTRLV